MKEYALYYSRLGLAVFPIKPKSKQPLTEHGLKDASKEPEQIEVTSCDIATRKEMVA